MQHLDGSALWYTPAHIEAVGRLHSFHYFLEGKPFGGRLDLPAFGPLSYLQPGFRRARFRRRLLTPARSMTE